MTESFKETCVSNLKEYVEIVERIDSVSTTLFRGQNSDWPLLPKVGRGRVTLGSTEPTQSTDQKEQKLLDEFKRRASGLFGLQPGDDWELLAIAQHHGLPTRLLDWSTNPLVALWFAVSGAGSETQHAVVWIYEADDGTIANLQDVQLSPFSIDRTRVYYPNHIAPRIVAQNSVFTVHKYIALHDWFHKFESNAREKVKLKKIKIYHDFCEDIRKSLDKYGINEATLFPDLDGISKYVEWKQKI